MAARTPLAELLPQRIALIKPSALGDIMHSLPVLAWLRRRYPQAHISWVVNRLYEPLLAGHPDLDAILPFDRHKARGFFQGTWTLGRFLKHIRRQHFDLVIDLQGLFRTGLMSFCSRAPRRVGLRTAREGSRWFYTDVIDDSPPEQHAVERYWRVAQALGAPAEPLPFHLPVSAEALHWAGAALAGLARPWLAVGVGARWRTKRWPPEHFATLVNKVQQHYGGTAVFVGAPDEVDLARQAARRVRGPNCDFTGQTTLPQLAGLLAQADVLLANDTGPLHLAVALGRPVVAPYTCTQARRTGPYGQAHRAVETKVWCAGSLVKQCSRLDCMVELTPERLWPVLDEVLATCLRQLNTPRPLGEGPGVRVSA
ncbi:MAG: glycosyltransferase family 9 protein [Gemmataceae bacterium]|nr:glycosyltransferase family 9 protein [Gemmataceae bacterium]